MHSSGISIWFFIGVLLTVYGAMILGYGLYQLSCIGVVGRAAVRRWLVLWSPFSPQPRKLERTAVTSPPKR